MYHDRHGNKLDKGCPVVIFLEKPVIFACIEGWDDPSSIAVPVKGGGHQAMMTPGKLRVTLELDMLLPPNAPNPSYIRVVNPEKEEIVPKGKLNA